MSQCSPRPHRLSYIPSFPSGIKRGPPARRHRETCCSVASGVSDSLRPPWTGAHQAPLSVGFPRQEYWSGLLFPSPGGLPDPGNEPTSPALQAGSLPLIHSRELNSPITHRAGIQDTDKASWALTQNTRQRKHARHPPSGATPNFSLFKP